MLKISNKKNQFNDSDIKKIIFKMEIKKQQINKSNIKCNKRIIKLWLNYSYENNNIIYKINNLNKNYFYKIIKIFILNI